MHEKSTYRIDFDSHPELLENIGRMTVRSMIYKLPLIGSGSSVHAVMAPHMKRFVAGWFRNGSRGFMQTFDAANYVVDFGIAPDEISSEQILSNSVQKDNTFPLIWQRPISRLMYDYYVLDSYIQKGSNGYKLTPWTDGI